MSSEVVSDTTAGGRLLSARQKRQLAAAVTVLLWASAFAGIRVGLTSYSPEGVALLRYLTASIVLAIYARVTQMPLPTARDLPGLALMGFLGFSAYNVALNAGEVRVPAGVASFLIASEPIYMALLAAVLFAERLSRRGWVGIVLSFLGVAVISFSTGEDVWLDPLALLILLAAVVKAMYSVGQRNYLRKYGALRFATYAIWAGTFFLLMFTPQLVREVQSATWEATLAVIYMGIFPGAIAYVSWSYVLSQMPSSVVGSFLYLVPVFAAFIAWGWLGEIPGPMAVAGGILILAGVITVNKYAR